ncbi:MAG: PTS IIA-like nitrogen regulatory protein PtsN [Gammaproteobacteria bacterium]|nr:PTS IIA-like nitrogen regulatory protein PtsN [Gammaproteobacteria bacterium]MBL6999489.1 PTS IIA-like nitrogen regulatory protein PtsN [Gammaproteobacteria bacterium]
MSITSLLVENRIFSQADITSKKRLLEFIAEKAAEELELPQNAIYNKLLERERLGSTGLGQGIAVPHARLDNLKEAHACLVKLDEGINYDAIDKQSVDLIFALFIPEESTEEHLQILAALARIFSQKTVTDKIRVSSSALEIISHIQQAELEQFK